MFLGRPRACTLDCLRSPVYILVSYKFQSAAKSLRNAGRVITRVSHACAGRISRIAAAALSRRSARRGQKGLAESPRRWPSAPSASPGGLLMIPRQGGRFFRQRPQSSPAVASPSSADLRLGFPSSASTSAANRSTSWLSLRLGFAPRSQAIIALSASTKLGCRTMGVQA